MISNSKNLKSLPPIPWFFLFICRKLWTMILVPTGGINWNPLKNAPLLLLRLVRFTWHAWKTGKKLPWKSRWALQTNLVSCLCPIEGQGNCISTFTARQIRNTNASENLSPAISYLVQAEGRDRSGSAAWASLWLQMSGRRLIGVSLQRGDNGGEGLLVLLGLCARVLPAP